MQKEREATLKEIEKIYKMKIPEDSIEYIKADVDGQELTWSHFVGLGCAFICQNKTSKISNLRICKKN